MNCLVCQTNLPEVTSETEKVCVVQGEPRRSRKRNKTLKCCEIIMGPACQKEHLRQSVVVWLAVVAWFLLDCVLFPLHDVILFCSVEFHLLVRYGHEQESFAVEQDRWNAILINIRFRLAGTKRHRNGPGKTADGEEKPEQSHEAVHF